jgi:tetratricopeptide (TPR) repeat protein
MPLSIGARLGPYEILSAIGAGGMGEVYKARDTRLHRVVAIKVLPPEFAVDAERLKRFEREAEATAALSHPNILAVYDVGTWEGVPYLVEELLEGESLRDRLRGGALSVREATGVAMQIARGLAAAHDKRIIHRDLKPANVFLTKDGTVKVLDFGLAKLLEAAAPEDAETVSVAPAGATGVGQVLGTMAYMAPEQARGRPVDARADLFALGVVLYEVLAGRRPFGGETATDTVAAILKDDPPPLPGRVPPALQRVVSQCLEKRPEDRFSSAHDVALALQAASSSGEAVATRRTGVRVMVSTHRWRLVAAGVLLLVGLAGGVWFGLRSIPGLGVFGRSPTTAHLTNKDTIVLADFDNKTGDAVFDDALKQGLSVALEQSPFLNLLSDQRVNETLKLMGRPAGDRLTQAVTREVCQRTGSKAMLTGSIAGLGSQYVIGLKALTCDTGDVLAEAQEQAAGKEAVLQALDAAASRVRSSLGESLSSVQRYATPSEEATTLSWEALKAYSLGIKAAGGKEGTDSLPFFIRAVDLDPNFAMAYSWIGMLYHDSNQGGRGAEYARKAYALREKVSERERFTIEWTYYVEATGELEKAAQTLELWQQTYPRDPLPFQLLGFISTLLGNWEKVLEGFGETQRLNPDWAGGYVGLAVAYIALNRLDEAEAVYKQAEARKLENWLLLQVRYFSAFLKGDEKQMAQLVSAAIGKPGAEDLLLATQADTDGWYGKLETAHELTGRAMDAAQHNDAKESAGGYQVEAALREVEAGNREQARADATAALKLAPNRDVRAIAALALARAGDTADAEQLAAKLDTALPLDMMVQRYWLPTIRAGVALERKEPNRAIELLKVPNAIELSEPSQLTIALCPAYLRGQAYLMLRDGNLAAAEFQKFIDHRGLVGNFPWGALARLGLARAYAVQGDTARARAAYKEFLTIWKDADPDLPVLKAARAEYARLQ